VVGSRDELTAIGKAELLCRFGWTDSSGSIFRTAGVGRLPQTRISSRLRTEPQSLRVTAAPRYRSGVALNNSLQALGIDSLAELVQIYNANPNLLPRPPE
jgi:hypothetical protein